MKTTNGTGDNREIRHMAESKVLPLKEAVTRYVKPGILLHLAGGIGGPSAAICEIIRQYHGRSPGFGLIQSTVTGHAINLLHLGMIRRLFFSACADISTSGRPSRVMQQAWEEKSIDLENWSLCALQQRLMAGALGMSFMPTRSISGSSMATDGRESFREIADPFGGDGSIGLAQALNPDVSIVHGCVADEYGNTILPIPYGEDVWGPLAAGDVLVTVEKLVSTDFIRQHAALVKLPGHIVSAVSVAPMGLHPFALPVPGLAGLDAYETDTEFLLELHRAFADSGKLDNWIKEWVLDCTTQEAYLEKLGNGRVQSLGHVPAGEPERPAVPGTTTAETTYSHEEAVLVAAAREITKSVLASRHRIILVGAGSRAAAVLLAYHQLRERGYELDIVTGNGQIGYEPGTGALGAQGLSAVYTSKMVTDTVTLQGVFIGGRHSRCLSVLGVGQIDKNGNTNSTLTAEGQFLVGSGGANDAANAREVLVIVNQSKDRFPEELSYITCPGDRVTTVVSTMGIFRKPSGKGELRLAACLPDNDTITIEERIQQVQDNCSWPLVTAEDVEVIPGPTSEELTLLRRLLPVRS